MDSLKAIPTTSLESRLHFAPERQACSAPILKIWRDVVLVPMTQSIDNAVAEAVLTDLLSEIASSNPKVVIIDLTGVPIIDTAAAGHLLNLTQAVGLMGAKCIFSGIRPQTALSMISLGINLKNVRTVKLLADALVLAIDFIKSETLFIKTGA